MAEFAPAVGAALIDDHSQWPYLAACLGVTIVGHLEPKAGVPPSAKHLQELAVTARDAGARGIITAPWFDPRHARTLAEATGLPVVPLAHQVGALPGTGSVRELHASNVAALRELLIDEAP